MELKKLYYWFFLKGPSCQRNENYEILFTVKKNKELNELL